MLLKAICLVLVSVLLHSSLSAQAESQPTAQSAAQMQQVLRKAKEKDKAVKVTLRQKIEAQRKFSGKVGDISETSFTFAERKTGKTMTFAYADVQQVNQKGMSKGAKIAILVVAGIVIAAIVVGYTITGGD